MNKSKKEKEITVQPANQIDLDKVADWLINLGIFNEVSNDDENPQEFIELKN
jgi:hypothetical protein